MQRYISTTRRPNAYHGNGKSAPFFEGWYFKLVDASQTQSWAIIPGIYKGPTPALSHAFIMVLDGRTHKVSTHRFAVDQFQASESEFAVRIAGNMFSADAITLNLPNLTGHVTFHNQAPWPNTWLSPGVMGWYAWMPFMECYHGVVSMNHALEGTLVAGDGASADFSGGRGYIEKDWGQAFPQTWIWTQANHFRTEGTSLFASIARIPFQGLVFPGFIMGFLHEGKLHRFTTYLQSRLEKVAVNEDGAHVIVSNRTHRLHFSVQDPGREARRPTALLPMPTRTDGMVPRVNESLAGAMTVKLETKAGEVIFTGQSRNAGLEIEGDTAILLKP